MTDTPQKSNIPEYSVSELAFSIKRSLEDGYGRIRVRGELSRVKVHTSGHMYSVLKDDQSNLDVVCWRGTLSKIPVKPEEGLEVICTGRISTYPARSNYQLIIESMELAGEGALLKMLEQRRKQLAAEGLFAQERKKPLPFLPDVIGVVTSPTGAVFRDIMHRINDRFPRHVILWPVLVQGDGAADQIVSAIEGFNKLSVTSHIKRPDVLIVGRGGGSLEDLMPFNEENVVRAVAASDIPVISAVGHETDTTLCDFAADMRAPTPTGAAEMAVPRRIDLMAQLNENTQRLQSAAIRLIDTARERATSLAARMGDPSRYLDVKQQHYDHLSDKIDRRFETYLQQKNNVLVQIASRLMHPKARIDEAFRNLNDKMERIHRAAARLVKPKNDQLLALERMLKSLSYKNVLERGYVVVRNESGVVLTDPSVVKANQMASLTFKDDKTLSAVLNPNGTSTPAKKKKSSNKTISKAKKKARADKGKSSQQTLF